MSSNRFTGERFEKALDIALGSAGLPGPGPGRPQAAASRRPSLVGEPLLLGLAAPAVRNRVKRWTDARSGPYPGSSRASVRTATADGCSFGSIRQLVDEGGGTFLPDTREPTLEELKPFSGIGVPIDRSVQADGEARVSDGPTSCR